MKKLLLLISIILISFIPVFSANAISETRYLRVINSETAFYSDENDESFLFYLPYTYYVKVIKIKENYLHVELLPENAPSLDGYVKKNDLYEDGQEVVSPYPSLTIKTLNDCAFYKDKYCSNAMTYLFKDRSLNYYGYYKSGENQFVYFVSYNGKLGYVKESDVIPFDIVHHPNVLTFLEESDIAPETVSTFSPEESEDYTNNHETLKLVIVILLMLAGALALFIAIFPKKPKKEENYYDENDFF
ncbi:MAG: hypothetical protein IJR66_05620 [Clostridia bacterium]|nr:hypothetical protein [Clostridia bacterium]